MSREEAGRKGGEARARQRQRGTNDNPAYLRRGFSWRGLKFSHAKDPPSYPIFKSSGYGFLTGSAWLLSLSNVVVRQGGKERRSCWTFGTVCDNYMIMITILI